jgi:hypothetical protein
MGDSRGAIGRPIPERCSSSGRHGRFAAPTFMSN